MSASSLSIEYKFTHLLSKEDADLYTVVFLVLLVLKDVTISTQYHRSSYEMLSEFVFVFLIII